MTPFQLILTGIVLIAVSFFFDRNPEDLEGSSEGEKAFYKPLSKILSVVAIVGYILIFVVAPAVHRWG